jgi:acyl carrier protein
MGGLYMDNHKRAFDIIANILDMDADTLFSETNISEISEWDSANFLAIIAELEEELELEVSIENVIEELANAKTIGEFLSLMGI